eukprot:2093510-Rhodomonas_salina.1
MWHSAHSETEHSSSKVSKHPLCLCDLKPILALIITSSRSARSSLALLFLTCPPPSSPSDGVRCLLGPIRAGYYLRYLLTLLACEVRY